ncbi:hypothetical protein PWT90_04832 [Aphanocladium album]|nr:hypothetical protein PWT90_04832 [Aphanocladium album]
MPSSTASSPSVVYSAPELGGAVSPPSARLTSSHTVSLPLLLAQRPSTLCQAPARRPAPNRCARSTLPRTVRSTTSPGTVFPSLLELGIYTTSGLSLTCRIQMACFLASLSHPQALPFAESPLFFSAHLVFPPPLNVTAHTLRSPHRFPTDLSCGAFPRHRKHPALLHAQPHRARALDSVLLHSRLMVTINLQNLKHTLSCARTRSNRS